MKATPWGFRDIMPEEAAAREAIADTVKSCFKEGGYLPVETPLLEDKAELEGAGRVADTPFKLFDDDGRLLVVRPDNTLSIVRMVTSRMRSTPLPIRLRYEAPVVRHQARFAGVARQFTQLGFELIGEGGAAGDIEMVSLVAQVMQRLGLPGWRVVCGSARPFMELLGRCGDAALARDALALIHANDLVGLDVRISQSDVDASVARAISALPRLHGGIEVLEHLDALLTEAGVDVRATDELRALARGLEQAGGNVCDALSFDFSIMNSFDYYTGLVFKAYAQGLTDPVGSGGRYDAIFDGAFAGVPHVPAAGFAFSLERLEAALQGADEAAPGIVSGAPAEAPDAEGASAGKEAGCLACVRFDGKAGQTPLRIAVPKGSLNEGTIDVLERAGLDVSGLRNPGRRLIVAAQDAREGAGSIGQVEYVIVRATDAPAFVACGGADCGFCGRDSLIEADLDLLQLVDLGYGACRFIEAEPAGQGDATERAYARRGVLRVATKYPRIAADWYARRGIAADIVSLHGNIELGPIVGMTDRIVDITATGTTLRENNLVITGEIMECTARFFVNPGASRLDPRVRELGDRLAALVEERVAPRSS